MKRIRPIGSALLAICALSAAVSTTASAALPEFLPTKGVTMTGTIGKDIIETLGKTKVECTSGSIGGEITGEKTASKVKITLKGCKSSGFSCNTAKAAAGEIVSNELTDLLEYINKAKKEVGLLFSAPAKEIFEYDCAGGIVKNKVLGSLICPITPVNTDTKNFTLICSQTKGDQIPTNGEGLALETLLVSVNGGAEEDAAEELTANYTFNVLSELMA